MKWIFRNWFISGPIVAGVVFFLYTGDASIAIIVAFFLFSFLGGGYAIYGICQMLDDNKKENERKRKEQERREAERIANETKDIYERDGVEIVNAMTFGPLAVAHAQLKLRNRNNYDVDVKIKMYQGGWRDTRITYAHSGTDYISGVDDNVSSTIRIKANSIRSVNLCGKQYGGRPTGFRISAVY